MTPPPPDAAVPELIVPGDRLPDPAGDAAFSIVRIGAEPLRDALSLDEALRQVPSFSLYRRTTTLGANPTTQGASLRAIAGSGASRALVTLDGVPQNDPFGGWVIWTATPPDVIGAAEIVRGAGAGPYGAGALTGVVALSTRTDDPRGLALSGGQLGYREAEGVFASRAGSGEVLLAGQAERSDGWIPVRAGRGAADRPLSLDAASGSARAVLPLGPDLLTLRAAGYAEGRGSGLVGAGSRDQGGQISATLARQPTPARWGWRLQAWGDASNLVNTSVSTSADRSGTTPADDQYATPALGWGLNAASRREARGVSVEIGVDARGTAGESRERYAWSGSAFTQARKAGGETLVAGAYLEASRGFGPWLLTGGARLDDWRTLSGERIETRIPSGAVTLDARPPATGGLLPTARLGLVRRFGPTLKVRAAAYEGFRPATLNELFRPFRVGNSDTEANAALRPERLLGAEAGLDVSAGPVRASATLFDNRLRDAVENVTLGYGPASFPVAGFIGPGGVLAMRENVRAVAARGLEAELDLVPSGSLVALETGLALTRSRVEGGAAAPQLTGKAPALTPAAVATAGLKWTPRPDLDLRLDARLEARRFEDDLNTLPLAASATLLFRMDWRVRRGLALFLAVDNLTDAAVQTATTTTRIYSYDEPRLVRAGLRFTP